MVKFFTMEWSIVVFLLILVLAFFLFSREVYPLEISALLVLVLLVFTGILDSRTALESFGNESIVLIGSLFVLVAGLKNTGIIAQFEKNLFGILGESRIASFALMLLLVGSLSAFVSNTVTLAISIPIVVSLANKFGDSPQQWLMPVAFASVLGGMNTLIGTSTNIIISSLLPDYGMTTFSLFTTARVGVPIALAGFLYLLFFSRYLLPNRQTEGGRNVGQKYDIRSFTAEVTVGAESPLCNKTIANSVAFSEGQFNILGIIRSEITLIPRGSLILQPEDRLIVEGNIDELSGNLERFGLEFHEQRVVNGEEAAEKKQKKQKSNDFDLEFHEVIVTARSPLNNRTAKEISLRRRYRLSLIALNRQGETLRGSVSEERILSGDILVVQCLDALDTAVLDLLGLVPLKEVGKSRYRVEQAPYAALIFVLSLLVGSVTDYSLAITCLGGAVLMVMSGILRSTEMYESVEWRVLLFIGAVLCLGKGMEASGTAAHLADILSTLFASLDPIFAISFFFILTVVMTQLLSNQATAVVMIPVAINTAQSIGLNPMTFVMSVTIAASCCFMTPFEPAFMLVYGPGEYRFSDFFRVGFLLAIISGGIALYVIPRFWWL